MSWKLNTYPWDLLNSVGNCKFAPNLSNSWFPRTNFCFPWRLDKLGFYCITCKCTLKAWPNLGASRCKLKTCVYLRLCLATTCTHLHWLVFTLVKIKSEDRSTSVFHCFATHPMQVNASLVVYFKHWITARIVAFIIIINGIFWQLVCTCQ